MNGLQQSTNGKRTRIASIDIGTNTALMLVADIDDSGAIHTIIDKQTVVRLGKGVDSNRNINEEAYLRCLDCLRTYKDEALHLGAQEILVTGTSALRDAGNRQEFIDRMHQATGLRIEVLSGEEEARWSYAGTIVGMPGHRTTTAVLDIGGGSTELILGQGTEIRERVSLDIGCVRLTERFLSTPPPPEHEIEELTAFIRSEIKRYPDFAPESTDFIGVAGTVTTLAAVDLGLMEYDRSAISGHRMTIERIEELYGICRPLSHSLLVGLLYVDPGRADIILSGIIILREIMNLKGVQELTVSAQGLRYGIALRYAQQK